MVLDQGIIIIKGMAKTDVFPSRTVRSLLPLCLCHCSLHAARSASVGMCSGNSGLTIIVFTSKCQEIKKSLETNYVDIVTTNWKIWPATQLANFYFVPFKHRILVN